MSYSTGKSRERWRFCRSAGGDVRRKTPCSVADDLSAVSGFIATPARTVGGADDPGTYSGVRTNCPISTGRAGQGTHDTGRTHDGAGSSAHDAS
jgi:hypothetical protein